ncbi:transcriptional regulator NrdR [candidate division WOR-1 bacterium RIFOXYA12_FULL_52_29]|uniref:Transcriptional repressor NrdR n=1 Tax=candidate division WOR-1 bacterium RIFOXYC12_FULL_54_18 TaxID=1802584 RepID=A0A1F4T6V2_UNCSA|nr:MAG: transcriptional regulator NrdR [candidate division WOR-1 bacterium RIFOXYA2_FULL_51_19]OGC17883.1 MAG: transcriptional regulator NrdR [candidate division WOR-1 bacterium RIFOXYA12_FULL_52_29]OGC26739.1 MAG: transcriptional regulator NrdR [candidate division WOR-1 bacterium RIFOXYB2_FULL_45_9]OGC28300.1 MAG: transcriptional regulator NrdR [candidate division WOR-1 bacterium RIFOXYC12_FULL_54_18]OGC31244.1 MAG: transcriptional regulator NrdR [candidate division WOR-1 bacterium RIFOXYB12_F
MKCPFCDSIEDKVLESREIDDGESIRRRRECLSCRGRFTSYERIEERPVLVIKRDGRREQFSRQKVLTGILRACEKRPVSLETMEAIVDEVEKALHREAGREVISSKVGELIMEKLHQIDKVAYIRFASVYRKFEHVSEFQREVEELTGRYLDVH